MRLNSIYFLTLAVSIFFFILGQKTVTTVTFRRLFLLWGFVALIAALPALLFVLFYTHWFDNAAWFYTLRSFPYSELAASGLGLGMGLIASYFRPATTKSNTIVARWFAPQSLLVMMALFLLVPYIKPVIAPLRVDLKDQWSEGVCLQSTSSTCGPSSAATLLRHFGIPASEQELARECFSYGAGTENWYIARALRKRGLNVQYAIVSAQPTEMPYPSIAGTKIGGPSGVGHFVAILGREGNRYIVGDPLVGRLTLTPEELHAQYYLTGFFLVVSKM